jgi:hypothetical protein
MSSGRPYARTIAADAGTHAADAGACAAGARTDAADSSDPTDATDPTNACADASGHTADGASYASANTSSDGQRDSADCEGRNPKTSADDNHVRSSMIISPRTEPDRHSRRSSSRPQVPDVESDRTTTFINSD